MEAGASAADYEVCRRLHRQYGTTYYFATARFRPEIRRRVHALYGFVRMADEWVDNPSNEGQDPACCLREYRSDLLRALEGQRSDQPVLRAFSEVARQMSISPAEPLCFLDAMAMDLAIQRYPDYKALERYMRGSAAAVGLMMCDVLGAGNDPEMREAAQSLGYAMQLTNFLRDVAEDAARGRIYLPQEELAAFNLNEDEILAGQMSDRFAALAQFQIERARKLYAQADQGIPMLPREAQKPVRLARILYSRILDRIEDQKYDVFAARARTSRLEKLWVAGKILLMPPQIAA